MRNDLAKIESLSKPLERMVGDNVLVELGERADQDGWKSNLIVAPNIDYKGRSQDLAEIPIWATVVLVGPGRRLPKGKLVPIPLVPGDRVLINAMAGDPVFHEGREMRIVREAAIKAVEVEDDDDSGD
jgi:co-chaperonin GroES (HSP10)